MRKFLLLTNSISGLQKFLYFETGFVGKVFEKILTSEDVRFLMEAEIKKEYPKAKFSNFAGAYNELSKNEERLLVAHSTSIDVDTGEGELLLAFLQEGKEGALIEYVILESNALEYEEELP